MSTKCFVTCNEPANRNPYTEKIVGSVRCVIRDRLYTPQTSVGTDGKLLKPREGNQLEIGNKGSYMDDRL
ncbi:hypothetical protein CWI61_07570, partial [Neisseria meningitidis]|uniref:hypothetical protein n=1 Tax=Neisseria meningitidis TaxID=487 RepID=UPI000CBBDC35